MKKILPTNDTLVEIKMYLSIFLVFVTVFYIYYISSRFSKRIITVKKDDITKASGKFLSNLIGDTDGNIYAVTSNPLVLFFNSAEILNELEEGKTYVIGGYGTRVPMFGLYPQITSVISENKQII
jgi:N-glycosylase/DNA lyase